MRKAPQKNQIILVSVLALSLFSCGKLGNKNSRSSGSNEGAAPPLEVPAEGADATAAQGEATESTPEAAADSAMALSGKDLYAKLCAGCHQELENSNVGKTPLNKLEAALATVPEMSGLKETSDKDLQAIIAALSAISPGKGKAKAD